MQIIGKKPVSNWLMLFRSCFNYNESGFSQWCWPDGRSLLDQSQITMTVFDIIKSEAMKQVNKQLSKKNGR